MFIKMIEMIWYTYIRRNRNLYAKKLGVKMGDECEILANPYICFGSEPWLIKLGDHVRITEGVKIYTHDGALWVVRYLIDHLANADAFLPVKIGNNVMLGVRCQVMPGVTIGDNVIVGAGSIVTKDIPSNSVAVGCPAKVICSIDDYLEKNKNKIVLTKNMSQKEKRDFLLKSKPEWFV